MIATIANISKSEIDYKAKMEKNNNNLEVIDLRIIMKKIWAKRKLYYIVLPIVFVLSCAYILCIPRTYTSSLSLAPEVNNNSNKRYESLHSLSGDAVDSIMKTSLERKATENISCVLIGFNSIDEAFNKRKKVIKGYSYKERECKTVSNI